MEANINNNNLFIKGYVQLYSSQYIFSVIQSHEVRSLKLFLPNITTIDPIEFIRCLNLTKQQCLRISDELIIKSTNILQEQGLLLLPHAITHNVLLIGAVIQTVIEFMKLGNKQIFWLSLNQQDLLVYV